MQSGHQSCLSTRRIWLSESRKRHEGNMNHLNLGIRALIVYMRMARDWFDHVSGNPSLNSTGSRAGNHFVPCHGRCGKSSTRFPMGYEARQAWNPRIYDNIYVIPVNTDSCLIFNFIVWLSEGRVLLAGIKRFDLKAGEIGYCSLPSGKLI